MSTNDLGQHPASLAVQSELEPGQPTVLVVQPEPGTASGKPVPMHSLRASRIPTAYANVHMFTISLSSGLCWTQSCYLVICHSRAIKTYRLGQRPPSAGYACCPYEVFRVLKLEYMNMYLLISLKFKILVSLTKTPIVTSSLSQSHQPLGLHSRS